MCQYKSALVVLTASGFDLLHVPTVDSHEDLIAHFGLKDSANVRGEPRFARVEYRPNDTKTLADIATYRLIVDEPRTPEWFTETVRVQVAEKLHRICKERIVTENKAILVGGPWVIASGVTIDKVAPFAVVVSNSGTVTDNFGTVTDNSGTVTTNVGTVTDNSGTVTRNSGTVTTNFGTVTDNSGTVTTNVGTVTTNVGTVTRNSGTVRKGK